MFDETSLDAFTAFNELKDKRKNKGTHAFIGFKFSRNCLNTTKQIPLAFESFNLKSQSEIFECLCIIAMNGELSAISMGLCVMPHV